jgi:hypothetical protein
MSNSPHTLPTVTVAPQPRPFEQLPSEVVTLCLLLVISPESYERGTEEIRELCCICRSFWRVIRGEPRFWNHLTTRDIDSIPLQLSHIGPRTPFYVYWRPQISYNSHPDSLALVLSVAHRWMSLVTDSRSYTGTVESTGLYAVARGLKCLCITTSSSYAGPGPEYPLSSDNLEYLELHGGKLASWSPNSFLHLKEIIISIGYCSWIGDILQVCPELESLKLSGRLCEEQQLVDDPIHLPTLRNLSITAVNQTLPPILSRIVALNLEELSIQRPIRNCSMLRLHSWACLNPTLQRILFPDEHESGTTARSRRYPLDYLMRYNVEHWRDRFIREFTSIIFDRSAVCLVRSSEKMGGRFTVSASLAFAIHFLPYPLDITSLHIDAVTDPCSFLQALSTPVRGAFPYPVLKELHLPSIAWGGKEFEQKPLLKGDVVSLLRKLWESRGPLANQPFVLDLFNSKGRSVYRHWLSTGSTRVELDLD